MILPPELEERLTYDGKRLYYALPLRRRQLAMQMMLAALHMTGAINQARVEEILEDVGRLKPVDVAEQSANPIL